MRIKIESTVWTEIGELITHYPCLQDFGFEIERKEHPTHITIKDRDGNNVTYECSCTVSHTPYIQISTIEDFFKLGRAVNKNLLFRDDLAIIQIVDGR